MNWTDQIHQKSGLYFGGFPKNMIDQWCCLFSVTFFLCPFLIFNDEYMFFTGHC